MMYLLIYMLINWFEWKLTITDTNASLSIIVQTIEFEKKLRC